MSLNWSAIDNIDKKNCRFCTPTSVYALRPNRPNIIRKFSSLCRAEYSHCSIRSIPNLNFRICRQLGSKIGLKSIFFYRLIFRLASLQTYSNPNFSVDAQFVSNPSARNSYFSLTKFARSFCRTVLSSFPFVFQKNLWPHLWLISHVAGVNSIRGCVGVGRRTLTGQVRQAECILSLTAL